MCAHAHDAESLALLCRLLQAHKHGMLMKSGFFLIAAELNGGAGLTIATKASGGTGDAGVPETPAAAASATENEQVRLGFAQHKLVKIP
jgi:hypothetical protein